MEEQGFPKPCVAGSTPAWGIFFISLILLGTARTAAAQSDDIFAKWLTGPQGYAQAMEKRRGTSDVVLIYFYTDWCPYCRLFNKEIVASKQMNDYLDHAIAVRINPDKGSKEKELARTYGVSGYPSFFVLPPGSDSPKRISVSGDIDPSEFVKNCQQLGERHREKKRPTTTSVKTIKQETKTQSQPKLSSPQIPPKEIILQHPVTWNMVV